MATKKAKGLPKKRQERVVKSLLELPKSSRTGEVNRPTAPQIAKAKNARPIKVKRKVVGRSNNRTEVSLGTFKRDDVAGAVKGFRQQIKSDFGLILKDEDGKIIARTHTTRANTTLAEQLALKALSKYGKSFKRVTLIASMRDVKPKRKAKKK